MSKQIFPWGHDKRYNDYSSFLKRRFDTRIQKIAINAGFTCPNRDGTKGHGGCTYCNNQKFNPLYCTPEKSVRQQLEEGIAFFSKKYKTQRYFAYFQAYTNTYGDISLLESLYNEALAHPDVNGIIIGTRPDCIGNEVIDLLKKLSKKHRIVVEYGIESTKNKTLQLINRGHTFEEAETALKKTAEIGIETGVHMIFGLPGESRLDIIAHAAKLSALPITSLKIHQLQIIKNTKLAQQVEENSDFVKQYEINEYIDLVIDFLEQLNPKIIIERVAGEAQKDFLVKRLWGLKNFEIIAKLEKRLKERDTYQGRLY